jgi:hypothetical protein
MIKKVYYMKYLVAFVLLQIFMFYNVTSQA